MTVSTSTSPLTAPDAPTRPADAIEVGRVLGAWGVKGGIKVKPFSSDPQALFSSKRWFLEPSEAKPGHQVPTLLRVASAREQGDAVVATIHDLTDRDIAQALAGARIFVARSSFPTPDEDEFYWVDLIGLDARNRADVVLGRIVGLVETGPHCVLRVQPADEQADEILIPFVAAYVDRVDLAGRSVHVDWEADY
ncbi:ribosome maturation factor RimM [Rubrivivax gelatinosus]|uniref:Ribosome maturation factor RimM n=1 Tax=Rubrivivax gelatinosus (strain NBRC 100245 / IL144) TaxID=983917 RepID=I0HNV2_RUBGI|nr:ribosome maturation factor RimM [Rubrivivax gelatinosus]BAL94689.1 16S rRNA processing protein RimM [Rubrivivax gelatinosus IL144]